MKTVAIISEYNPFHLGHLHQINKIKKYFQGEEVVVVSIMSGNFIQRGEPSIIDKFSRCEAVLMSGVNLCLEIPVHISLSSAEGFAHGSVNILNSLRFIDYICFGCEIPDKDALNAISDALISINDSSLDKYLKEGVSYAKAKELFITDKFKDKNISNLIKSPNNILAIEYICALKRLNSKIKTLPIQRVGGGYNDGELNSKFSSATSIRNTLNRGEGISILKDHLPQSTFNVLNKLYGNTSFINKEHMFPYIKYKLLTKKGLDKIEGVSEGLDNKFYTEIMNANSLDNLILRVKSKRYTYTRLSRIMCKFFIGFEDFSKEEINSFNNYVRILGFDKKGMDLLNGIKKSCELNIISKFNKKNSHLAPLDLLSTRTYSIINESVSPSEDFLRVPIMKS